MRFARVLRASLATAAVLATVPVTKIHAQEDEDVPRPRGLGLYWGRSWARFSNDELNRLLVEASTVTMDPRPGSQIGAYFKFPYGRYFTFQAEVHYVQKGGYFELKGDGNLPGETPLPLSSGSETRIELAYFEFPMLARWDFGKYPKSRLFVIGGPNFSVRSSCRFGYKAASFNYQLQCDEGKEVGVAGLEKDPFTKFDYGAIGGVGAGFRFFGFQGSMQGRYSIGMSNFVQSRNPYEVRSNTFSFLFGFEI